MENERQQHAPVVPGIDFGGTFPDVMLVRGAASGGQGTLDAGHPGLGRAGHLEKSGVGPEKLGLLIHGNTIIPRAVRLGLRKDNERPHGERTRLSEFSCHALPSWSAARVRQANPLRDRALSLSGRVRPVFGLRTRQEDDDARHDKCADRRGAGEELFQSSYGSTPSRSHRPIRCKAPPPIRQTTTCASSATVERDEDRPKADTTGATPPTAITAIATPFRKVAVSLVFSV